MPIGPVTPGAYTTVTPDIAPVPYTSLPAPSPTMLEIASDIAALTLAVLNVQAASVSGTGGGSYSNATPITLNGALVSISGAGLHLGFAGMSTDGPIVGGSGVMILSQIGETIHALADLITANSLTVAGATSRFTLDTTAIGEVKNGCQWFFDQGSSSFLLGSLSLQITGHIRERWSKMTIGSNLTTGHTTADYVFVPNGQTGGHTITVQDGPAVALTAVKLVLYSEANVTVAVAGTGISFNISATITGAYRWVMIIWDGTDWTFGPSSAVNP